MELLRSRAWPILLIVLCTGCFSYEPVELENVLLVELQEMNQDSISVKVVVQISNPNGYRIKLTDPDVNLYINRDTIGKAVFSEDLVLEKNSTKHYTIPISAGFNGKFNQLLIASLGGLLGGSITVGADGTVVGKAGIIKRRVPFKFEEDLSNKFNR